MEKEKIDEMGKNAVRYVKENYDYKNISFELQKICEELINEKNEK